MNSVWSLHSVGTRRCGRLFSPHIAMGGPGGVGTHALEVEARVGDGDVRSTSAPLLTRPAADLSPRGRGGKNCAFPLTCATRTADRRKMRSANRLLALALICSLVAVAGRNSTPAAEPTPPKTPKVDFNREVRPILAKNCFACHGQDEAKRAKGLRLDRRDGAIRPLKERRTCDRPRRSRFQ